MRHVRCLLMLTAVSFLAQPALVEGETITIRAYIDGVSQLHLSGSDATWNHLQWQAPGLFDGAVEPTVINGVEWYATFADGRWCIDCWSDTFTGVSPALPGSEFPVSLTPVSARGSASIAEYPSATNNYTVVVEFNDDEGAGAVWYEVVLDIAMDCEMNFSVPIYDGQTWTHNCDAQVNGVVVPDPGCPAVTEIFWDWGDGAEDSSWFPAFHSYGANGTYSVTVTAVDGAGDTVSDSIDLEIAGCEPLPSAPGDVGEGLALWLVADSGISHWSNWVSQWRDQSDQERHLYQWSRSLQPELVENVVNGHDVLRFDVDSLPFDGEFLVDSNYTIFVVEGRDRFGLANFFVGGSDPMPNGNLVIGYEGEDLLRLAHFANDLDAAVPSYVGIQEFALTTFAFDRAVGRSILRFGEEIASDDNTLPLVSYGSPAIGSFYAFNYFYGGDIAEMVFFDRPLACGERAAVELYLADKYGLELAYADAIELCAEAPILEIVTEVLNIDLQEGISTSLAAKLESALAALEDARAENDQAAINTLGAFINAVEAQRGKKISNEDADRLIGVAEEIIAFLAGP